MTHTMNNNIAVIFKSKYGTTKRYAEWIAEELSISIFEASTVKPSQLLTFDAVIYGGGLYAGGIDGVSLVTKNTCKLIAVFTVGLSKPDETDYSAILNKNFSKELLQKIKIFHLRGGIDYKRLGLVHKSMMAMLVKFKVEKIPLEERTSEVQTMLDTYGDKVDFTDQSTIKPLVDYVRSI